MTKNELITLRDGIESDHSFIYATFLRGLYYGDSWFGLIPKHIFMTNYHTVVAHLIEDKNTFIHVACLKDDPEVILGYAILSRDQKIVHWVFCKKSWRNIGIAKSLVPSTFTTVTHLTKAGLSIIKKKNQGIEFNPFLT